MKRGFTLVELLVACRPKPGAQRRRRPTRAAFTLVELLVVIAIIGVLMALVMPAVTGALDRARQVACLSNLRQIGIGVEMYKQGNRNFVPSSMAAGAFWQYRLADYLGTSSDGSIDLLKAPGTVFACPSVRNDPEPRRSYGFNIRLPEPGGGVDGSTDNNIRLVKTPSETLLIADALNTTWIFGPSSLSHRHANENCGALFCDGHLAPLSLAEALSIPPWILIDGR